MVSIMLYSTTIYLRACDVADIDLGAEDTEPKGKEFCLM